MVELVYSKPRPSILTLIDETKLYQPAPYLKICAPMVRYSKLPFREVIKKYNVDLLYTPMILADVFASSPNARTADFSTNLKDTPLVVQFAANDGVHLADAVQFVEKYCFGVDINCGCPQKWAIGEGIGAALMKNIELVSDMVKQVKMRCNVNCSIKIRVHKDLRQTVEMVRRAEQVGVDWITVHGRTTKQSSSDPVDLDAIKLVKQQATVPLFANGDVFSLNDANHIINHTQADGVMAARGLLQNPTLFSGTKITPLSCVKEYMASALNYGTPHFIFHHHLMFMLEDSMSKAEKKTFNVLTSIPAILDHMEEFYDIQL